MPRLTLREIFRTTLTMLWVNDYINDWVYKGLVRILRMRRRPIT
jgi:hypothetical protein